MMKKHFSSTRTRDMANDRGFTLVELIVVMAIFIVVIIIAAGAFERIVRTGGHQARIATTEIAGIVGLEMFRSDIAQAGFALPWSFSVASPTAANSEVTAFPSGADINADTFATFNDFVAGAAMKAPRAVVSATTNNGTDYLVLKSALLAPNSTATGRWGFINYSSTNAAGDNQSYIRTINDPNVDLRSGDRVITIQTAFSATTGSETKQLMMAGASDFSYTVPAKNAQQLYIPTNAAYQPADPSQSFFAYAISISDSNLRMPYNRADYYINFTPPVKPQSCNSGTGILYKAVAGQADNYTTYPLLDCVGDMQVVYYLDMDDDGNPETYADPDGNHSSPLTFTNAQIKSMLDNSASNNAQLIRQRLKSLQVYILAQEGKKDRDFSYPYSDASKVITVGPQNMPSVGKVWTASDLNTAFGSEWNRYRWKVYSISVNLVNLQ
jgi:type II secretory pathway pseudopilin PulG